MSQFGGGKPPGQWHRPAAPGGAPQLSGFPAVNFGGVPMVGMGVPMGMVNQAAFSSPNVLGMQGIMGAVPQQSLGQQQPNFQPQNGLQQSSNLQQGAGAKNQRTFVGVVTKMLDTYGFVDDDVFFQHSVIRGAHPRVGDKVMVEANYNPSMPFKWNAYRIQLLNAATQQEPPRPAQSQQQMAPQRGNESQRWVTSSGPSDRNGRGDSPIHRAQPKPVLLSLVVSGSVLRHRYPKLYLPSDYVDLSFDWVRSVQLDLSLDLNNPIQFHVFNKEVELPLEEGKVLPELEPEDADHRHQVKVLLLSHEGKPEIVKKSFCLMADGTTDDHQEPQALYKNLQFLVGARGKETMGIGGSWSPSMDGANPDSPATMIRTAVRTTKALTGIDLSAVSQWFSMVQIRYYRSDKQRVDHVNLLLPDTQSLAIDDATWAIAESAIGEQLKAKIAFIDAMKIEEEGVENVEQGGDEQKKEEVAPTEEEPKQVDVKEKNDPDLSMASEGDEKSEKVEDGQGPTNWSKLDPKSMKVAELRVELELRGLETKGIKTLLVQRLQTALDSEKANEANVEMKDVSDAAVKQEGNEENPAAFIAPSVEETKAKTEAEAKKEQEENEKKKKKEEQLEKEKKDKRELLEKHYQLPKDKKILVFPSKTFKSGKFDCKVMSLNSLLDYRADDNKENQFEVSLFAEAFREMLERNSAFTIYETLVNCGDRDAEKKRRDEAREKIVDTPKDDEKKDEKEEEKKDEEKKEIFVTEKIELKSLVANRTVYEAFSLFDANLCGYVNEKDIEEILYNGEFGISRGQIQKLAKKLSVRDRVNYRHLTDVLTDMDGNVRHTPGGADDVVETDDLIRGFGVNLAKASENQDSTEDDVSKCNDEVVIINGSVVNVAQKLKLLKQVEHERDTAKSTVNEQSSLIDQLRDAKSEIEKKKKDIESHYHKSNKKLNETSSQLKTLQEDHSALKQALQDCKRHADRIFSVVEKALPAAKKEEKNREKEKERSDKKDEKQDDKQASAEKEPAPQEILEDSIIDTDASSTDKGSGEKDEKKAASETKAEHVEEIEK
ncbi:unnamed protein product [Caenorhabditis sp. 36 PRJEB53466]|nr:unnamed protein product [Caenorhabditis sp. 36 PRJEB53466]